jgi:hypothetical protein
VSPIRLRPSWRTWLRWSILLVVTLAIGVLAATDSVAWYLRLLFAVAFVVGAALALDAVVLLRAWEVDGIRWWIPNLAARARIIPVDEQRVVELVHTYPARLRITGSKGSRDVVVSPIVSYRDLDRWFDVIAGASPVPPSGS